MLRVIIYIDIHSWWLLRNQNILPVLGFPPPISGILNHYSWSDPAQAQDTAWTPVIWELAGQIRVVSLVPPSLPPSLPGLPTVIRRTHRKWYQVIYHHGLLASVSGQNTRQLHQIFLKKSFTPAWSSQWNWWNHNGKPSVSMSVVNSRVLAGLIFASFVGDKIKENDFLGSWHSNEIFYTAGCWLARCTSCW